MIATLPLFSPEIILVFTPIPPISRFDRGTLYDHMNPFFYSWGVVPLTILRAQLLVFLLAGNQTRIGGGPILLARCRFSASRSMRRTDLDQKLLAWLGEPQSEFPSSRWPVIAPWQGEILGIGSPFPRSALRPFVAPPKEQYISLHPLVPDTDCHPGKSNHLCGAPL